MSNRTSMYNQLGSREICDVVFRAKSPIDIGKMHFEKDEPVLYIESAKTSSLDGEATTVYATGGKGNNRLVAWEGDKTVTYTIEDALISPLGMNILTGAGLTEATNDEIIHYHQYADVEARYSEGQLVVDLTENLNGETLCTQQKIFGMLLNGSGTIVNRLGKATVNGNILTFESPSGTTEDSYIRVDFYTIRRKDATEITIEPDKFAGYYYVEANTLYRQVSTGKDVAAVINIPKVKIQSKFNFAMSSTGDPSTFTFTMDAFPDYLKYKRKKVLASMTFIEDQEDNENEDDSNCEHTGEEFGDDCEFGEEKISVNTDAKLLTIPYVRYQGGDVSLKITDDEGNIVFREKDTLSSPNQNASFTWSLRDFSLLDNGNDPSLTYDEEGHFIYTNGCNIVQEVAELDCDNDAIIPSGTELTIQITVNETVIETTYTVKNSDVIGVTH